MPISIYRERRLLSSSQRWRLPWCASRSRPCPPCRSQRERPRARLLQRLQAVQAAGCRAEQDSERSLSLPNLLLLTSILTLFSFGVATKALILAISSPLCVASSCVLSFAAAVEHNTVNSICTRDIVCLTHYAALQLEPVRFNAGRTGRGRGKG